ncbi:hypothetical protein DY218_05780 [Streptomyces triticagri]|uniref:Aminodeoxyfutalosine deaminase/Imidazolonepropionase-like composite domain-containing protein n=1 Tax=Streptomyces triticagri TaxID=2293568 RepID=A0A372MA01_9ACTN|nr:hypothetical protein [Streptomyces triticagri]RFU87762.1 hypothetical protein DY218_05780 [Streptomyces triticagri]
MLTIHRVQGVRPYADHPREAETEHGHALVVDSSRIAAIGPYEELLAQYGDRARVRTWDGILTPGRYEPDAPALLDDTYWPDPREADVLGTAPLTGDALAALDLTGTRWAGSARRGLQRLLASGTTALAGPFRRPEVLTAAERSGIRRLAVAPERPLSRSLTPSGAADFAVYAPDGGCLVTVLGGRLVHRAR